MKDRGKEQYERISKCDVPLPEGFDWIRKDGNHKEQELRQIKTELIGNMRKIVDMADDQKRAMTVDENAAYQYADGIIERLNQEIDRREKERGIAQREREHGARGGNGAMETRAENVKGFRHRSDELSENDFWRCLVNKDYGPLAPYRSENRGAVIGTGVSGGFAVPETTQLAILDGLLADQGIFPRIGKEFVSGSDTLNVVTFENCEIDDHGLYGFSTPTFVAEGGTISDETPRLTPRTWHLKKLISHCKVSIEMNATGAMGANLTQAMTNVLRFGLEKYIVSGNSVQQPQGLILAPCSALRARAGAGAISYTDVVSMMSTTRLGNGNVWIGSQTIIPQLASMVDAGSHAVWNSAISGGAAQAVPQSLLGYPMLFNLGCSPAVGSKGDLMFCSNLEFYKAVIFQDIIVQVSDSAFWSTGEIGLRVYMLLDMGALPMNAIKVSGSTYGWHTVLSA